MPDGCINTLLFEIDYSGWDVEVKVMGANSNLAKV